VGTGFHQELTGRENIYLNGSILGMSRGEIRRQFDAIVDFAGVEQFLDTPVKRYSSGMYVRLAFAVAAHLRSEILIVDEVLAVGDAEFQRKCLGKMKEVSSDGRTVLFVSHNKAAVRALCSRGVFLASGGVAAVGSIAHVLEQYEAHLTTPTDEQQVVTQLHRPGTGELRINTARPVQGSFAVGEPVVVDLAIVRRSVCSGKYFISGLLCNSSGTTLAQIDSKCIGFWFEPRDTARMRITVRHPWLKPGNYTLNLYICAPSIIVDHLDPACTFRVDHRMPYEVAVRSHEYDMGLVIPDYSVELQTAGKDTAIDAQPAGVTGGVR
jgi:lipopolysaccharide transport system ATP-binding protein